jgi:hypothetical protein
MSTLSLNTKCLAIKKRNKVHVQRGCFKWGEEGVARVGR